MLNPIIAEKLKQAYQKMVPELPSQEQISAALSLFRSKFGPDVLQAMDGEALLNAMHDTEKTSLVYWLEFKNDDELPDWFGSIAGGSALKFGIYRRKDTGKWMSGSSQKQTILSTQEAIDMARKHRDQFVAGCDLLAHLPVRASRAAYGQLQKDMDRLAPDVSRLAWGHKYFSMMFPEKLEQFHSPFYQRFHLIKLLQNPEEGKRYDMAWQFAQVAEELEIPLLLISSTLNEAFGRPYYYWRLGTSNGDDPGNKWPEMLTNRVMAIGWTELGDLTGSTYTQASKEVIRVRIAAAHQLSDSAINRMAGEVLNFVTHAAVNDLIVADRGQNVLGIGRIVGPYRYLPETDFPHQREVEWLSADRWSLPVPEGICEIFTQMLRHPENLLAVEEHLLGVPEQVVIGKGTTDLVIEPREPSLTGVGGQIQNVLARKKQVILYGPPGTGKTHWAEKTALELAAHRGFGLPFDELTAEQVGRVRGDGKGWEGLVRICCFHPSYGYEDFMEGYRPLAADTGLQFQLRDGVFKRVCRDAKAHPALDFYLIVDEINRADVARVFGELLTVLEVNKRGKGIVLPLSGELFFVPENVYLIGTMNTADRSITLLDTALRRRFGFVELMPSTSVLAGAIIEGIPVGRWLEALNKSIVENVGRNARNLQIGHAYFMSGGKPVSDIAQFARVLQEDVLPLLEEYCYEDYSTLNRILGDGLIDVSAQSVKHEVFKLENRDKLIQALGQAFPEVSTTEEAVQSELQVLPESEDELVEPNGQA